MAHRFADVDEVTRRLAKVSYLATPMIANVAFLADRLEKPVLAEGPAGVGKTELAKALAAATGARLIRLQCYEGLDESKALYEWNYKKQLLRIQADRAHDASWADVEADIFSEPFLLTRPLLEAIRAADPVVLLIDEVDRVEVETEALLLEVLSDFQVSIPELGTVAGTQRPLIVLTSNATRELSEALRRRCLYLYIDYPDVEREREIVRARVPEVDELLATQIAEVVRSIRQLELKKAPSISETIDWARTLVLPGAPVPRSRRPSTTPCTCCSSTSGTSSGPGPSWAGPAAPRWCKAEGPASGPAPRHLVRLGVGHVDQPGPVRLGVGDPRPLEVAVAGRAGQAGQVTRRGVGRRQVPREVASGCRWPAALSRAISAPGCLRSDGWALATRASDPATCGAAIEVPWMVE